MDPVVTNPFSTRSRQPASPYDDSSVMTSGARGMVSDFQRAEAKQARVDPLAQQMTELTHRKTYIGQVKQAAEQLQQKFLDTTGADLFQRDAKGKLLDDALNPGNPIPKMGADIDTWREKSNEKVGLIRGALTSAVAGEPTEEAKAAAAKLAETEPIYKAKLDQWKRIQEQVARAKSAHDDVEMKLGQLAAQRLARDGVDIFGTPAEAPQPTQQNSSVVEQQTHTLPVGGSIPPSAPIPQGNTTAQPAAGQPPVEPTATQPGTVPASQPAGPTPLALVKMHQRMKDNEAVIAMETTNPNLKKALTEKNERMKEQFLKGLALQTPISQQRVMDITRDPTLGEQVKNFVGKIAGGIGTTVLDTAESLARNAKYVPNLALPGITAFTPDFVRKQQADGDKVVKEFANAMRDEAAGWGLKGVPAEVAQKLNDSFASSVGQGIGSTIGFIGPTSIVGGVGKMAGLTDAAITKLMTATVAATGAASESNNFRREAEMHLQPLVDSGEITKAEMDRSLGVAEVFGAAVGSSEAFTGISRMAKRIGEGKVGRSFLRTLFDVAGKKGASGAAKWLKGPGAKAAVDVASEMLEESAQEFGQNTAENLYASLTFDKGREILPGASEAAGSAAISTLIVSSLTQALGLPGQTRRYKALGEAVNKGAEDRRNGQQPGQNGQAAPISPTTPTQPASGQSRPAETKPTNGNVQKEGQGVLQKEGVLNPDGSEQGADNTPPAHPVASQDGKVVNRWTFTDKAGEEQSVTATGLKDAISKLPEGYKPDLTKAPRQETVAAPKDHATTHDLAGDQIDKEWTAFSPESQSLGVPRADMPQVKAEHRGALTQFLKGKGITSTEESVLPGSLKPTQAEFSQGKVDKARGFTGGDRAILVSQDGHVIDGHHQWMAKLTDEPNKPMRVIRLDAPVKDLLDTVKEFPSAETAGGSTEAKTSKPAPAEFLGIEGEGSPKAFESYRLTEDIPGHVKGSSVSRKTLEDAGYTVPPISQPAAQKPGPNIGVSKPQATAKPAGKPITQGSESGAGNASNPRSGAETPLAPAPVIARGKNSPASFTKAVTTAANIKASDKAGRFLADFSRRLHKAAPTAFADMEVHVLTQEQWDAHKDIGRKTPNSAGAYDQNTNTLYINASKSSGDSVVNTIVHEAGHFAEKFYLGEKFTQGEWEKLTHEQRQEAWHEYAPKEIDRGEKDLQTSKLSRSEWVAMQFARVVRGDTEGMGAGMKAKLQKLLADIRELVNRWVGNGKLTTPALDAKILEMLGYVEKAQKKAGTAPVASQEPLPPAIADQPPRDSDAPGRVTPENQAEAPAQGEPEIKSSRPKIRAKKALIKSMEADLERFAGINPGKAKRLRAKIRVERSKLVRLMAAKKPGKNFSVGQSPLSGPDILTRIEQLGGVKSKNTPGINTEGGHYDRQDMTFTGTAKLLLRKEGGQTPDDMAQYLHDDGLISDGLVSTMETAIQKALVTRKKELRDKASQEYQAKFEMAFLGNEQKYVRDGQTITVDDLNVGDKFDVNGEKFKVIAIDEDGNVTVKDGITKTLSPGTPIYPDKGEVTKAKAEAPANPEDDPFAEQPAPPITPAPAPKKKFDVKDDLKKDLENLFGTPAVPTLSEYNRRFGERTDQANALIGKIVRDFPAIRSRKDLAEFIAEVSPKAKPFSESLFKILSAATETDESGSVSDWHGFYSQSSEFGPTKENRNEPRPDTNLERDRQGANPGDRGGQAVVRNEPIRDGSSGRDVGKTGVPGRTELSPATGDTDLRGEDSDQPLPEFKPGAIGPATSTAGSEQLEGGGGLGEQGTLAIAHADTGVGAVAADRPSKDVVARIREKSLAGRVRDQRAADGIEIIIGDAANIDVTLPVLLPEQRDDVLKAERRLFIEQPTNEDPKRGILFTNGTGTGKTYTGLGIIKRFVRQGKDNVLILVPSAEKANDWANKDGPKVGVKIGILEDTNTAGSGVVATTYANFRMNDKLRNRDFDLIVYDESHKLMENEQGEGTAGFEGHRFVTNHPERLQDKVEQRIVGPRPVRPRGEDIQQELQAYEEQMNAWNEKRDSLLSEIATEAKRLKDLTKTVFLSATPFAYHKTLKYADGYLFKSSDARLNAQNYNTPEGFDKFLVENFGYRMRYNKLTQPESGVDIDLMERAFTDRLMKTGAMSGRAIDVPYDYSREFVLVNAGLGAELDRGMGVLLGWIDREQNDWQYMGQIAKGRFRYHVVQQLLESIKATQSIERLRQHIALGRKVIVFHSYVNAMPSHPFRGLSEFALNQDGLDEVKEFEERYPELVSMEFGAMANPLTLLEREFGDAVAFYNGTVSGKNRSKAVRDFNDDNSPVKIIVGQTQSIKEGVSLHDTTGKHMRVGVHYELPIRPTDATQEEGRGYRIGQASNTAHEYIVLHTNAEKYAYGSKINQRVRTAENLALGGSARALENSFKQGYLNPISDAPSLNQGKGGKEADRRASVMSFFDQAKSYYFSRQRKTSKTKSAEGIDYLPTPEPLGYKMVEWLGAKSDEHLLEPSAGHGAVARFFPNFTTNHFVEPSMDLANELRIKIVKGTTHVERFEDFNIVNKFDGVAMNPPYGTAGRTAIDHLEKAVKQLKNGGRVIAIIPEGPSADAKFNKWYEDAGKQFVKVAEFGLPRVTFERAGTEVKTRIVVIDRIDNDDLRTSGQTQSRIDIEADTVDELFNRIENLSVPERKRPTNANTGSGLAMAADAALKTYVDAAGANGIETQRAGMVFDAIEAFPWIRAASIQNQVKKAFKNKAGLKELVDFLGQAADLHALDVAYNPSEPKAYSYYAIPGQALPGGWITQAQLAAKYIAGNKPFNKHLLDRSGMAVPEGWQVRKGAYGKDIVVPPQSNPLQGGRDVVLPVSQTAQTPGQISDFSSEEFKHTKTGASVYVARPARYLGSDTYANAKRMAVRHGGHYSSFKGAGAIPGFHFENEEARNAFLDEWKGDGLLGTPSSKKKKDQTTDMFDSGLAAEEFTLSGGEAQDFEGITDEKEASAEAKKKQDDAQGSLFGTPAVQGTDEQEKIINKVTSTLEDKRTFSQRITDALASLGDYIQREVQQKILDRLVAIKRAEKATYGTNDIDASISPYKWSRLTSNLAGVMEYLLKHGQFTYRNGSIEMVNDTKGLVDILKPVVEGGKLRLWEGYIAAFRANRLLAEGKEKNFGKQFNEQTGEWEWDKARAQREINTLLELGKDYPEFEQVRQDYVAFQKSVLDFATKAGLIDPAKRALWERSDYVPFYRIVDALDNPKGIKGPNQRRGFSGQTAGIRKLKGGPQQVAILENIFRNIEQMVDASFKNIAMQRITDMTEENTDLLVKIPYKAVPFKTSYEETVDALEKAGVDTSALSKPELEEVVTFWRMRAPEGNDIVSVMHQGKPVYFRVKDKPLLRSILALGPDRHSWWMRMLMAPKKALTSLVTLDPAFMAANTIRDSFSAWVISDSPIKPGWDSMRGFAKSLKNDPIKLSIMVNGGGTGHYNNMKESEVRRAFLRMTREERDGFMASIIDSPMKLARLYKDIGRASENANRIAIAESATKRGASPAEAAFQALDIMDFGLRGDSKALAFFLDTVPFMNARIQGLYRLGRGLMNDPKRVATHGAMIIGATLALLASNWDDDRYWDLPDWDRDMYYHLWIAGRHIRIPKPFEVGQIFSTMPERMFQFVAKDGDGNILKKRILSMIGDTFAMNPIPQAFKPLAERAMNRNLLTGGKIISQGDEYKSPEQQYNNFTSALAREIAQAAPDNAPEWLRSPKTLDFLIRGYTGTLGMYAMDVADAIVRPVAGYPERPANKAGDYWLAKRFIPEGDLRDSKYVSEFYNLNQDVTEIMAKVKALRESGDLQEAAKVTQENRSQMAYEPVLKSTAKALSAIRSRERDIYANPRGMSPEARREELARLAEQKNRLAKQTVTRAPGRSGPIYNPFK